MNKTLLFALTLSTGIFAATAAHAESAASLDWAGKLYVQSKAAEMTLARSQNGGDVLGVRVMQKDVGGTTFCRKSVVVTPGARASYACYTVELEGRDARDAYEHGRYAETNVLFLRDNSPRIGQSWNEKMVDDRGEEILCVKTSAVVPRPVPTYVCYSARPPLGGGISIGN